MANTIDIQLDSTSAEFTPGSTVSGRVIWATSPDNKDLELRLFWYTEGRGTQDMEIAHMQIWDTSSRYTGNEVFSFTLPAVPFSFSGRLVSVQWALEAVALQSDDSYKLDITVSPSGKEIVLSEVASSVTSQKKKWGKRK